jgi:hypothetical protein
MNKKAKMKSYIKYLIKNNQFIKKVMGVSIHHFFLISYKIIRNILKKLISYYSISNQFLKYKKYDVFKSPLLIKFKSVQII